MMQQDYEIYLSFDSKDDLNFKNKLGWVSEFRKFFSILISQLIGKQPVFKHISELENKPGVYQFLFIFLSNNNINSHKIEQDFNYFLEIVAGESAENRKLVMKKQVFKIKKYPVPYHLEPGSIQEMVSYNFFGKNRTTGSHDLYKPFHVGNKMNDAYWYELSEVVYNVYRLLENMELPAALESVSPVIYLSETSPDVALHRLVIKRELLRMNYRVLPDKNFPGDPEALRIQIESDMKQSNLVIHMIGQYRSQDSTSGQSIAELQATVAGEIFESGESGFSRLTWIPTGLKIQDARQQLFFENLKKEMEVHERCDMVQTNIEDLKEVIEQKFNKKYHRKEINNIAHDKEIIYLLYDHLDKEKAEKIAEQLGDAGYEVLNTAFEGNFIELREIHNTYLKKFDKALVFCDKSNENWLRMKLMDLLKSSGIGRKKPILAKILMTDDAAPALVENFKIMIEVQKINNEAELSFNQWQELIEGIQEMSMTKTY